MAMEAICLGGLPSARPSCSPNSVATLGVLTVSVKARCSFEVVSCPRPSRTAFPL